MLVTGGWMEIIVVPLSVIVNVVPGRTVGVVTVMIFPGAVTVCAGPTTVIICVIICVTMLVTGGWMEVIVVPLSVIVNVVPGRTVVVVTVMTFT
jgi:hypothetical protein